MKDKAPSFQEALDALGPHAMDFLMSMVSQNDTEEGRQEADKADHELPTPQTPDEARGLPSGSHFKDPSGKRRRVP
jgi:hypothetical protein